MPKLPERHALLAILIQNAYLKVIGLIYGFIMGPIRVSRRSFPFSLTMELPIGFGSVILSHSPLKALISQFLSSKQSRVSNPPFYTYNTCPQDNLLS